MLTTAFFKVLDNLPTVTVKCLECQEDVSMSKAQSTLQYEVVSSLGSLKFTFASSVANKWQPMCENTWIFKLHFCFLLEASSIP